jgi:putative Holliday junction resolvase
MISETRTMGLDVGSHTIGVAVSDLLGFTAQGVEVIRRTSEKADFERLSALVNQFSVSQFVVGLPKNMNNSIGPQGEYSLEFAKKLEEIFHLPVLLWDERLTTRSAEQFLISANVQRKKRRQVIDKLAASLILQSYLDSLSKESENDFVDFS